MTVGNKKSIIAIAGLFGLSLWVIFTADSFVIERRMGLPYKSIFIPFKNKNIFRVGDQFMKSLKLQPDIQKWNQFVASTVPARVIADEIENPIVDFRLAAINRTNDLCYLDYWVSRIAPNGTRFETSSRLYLKKVANGYIVDRYNAAF